MFASYEARYSDPSHPRERRHSSSRTGVLFHSVSRLRSRRNKNRENVLCPDPGGSIAQAIDEIQAGI